MARFDGKPVIMVPVADGIHKAEELVNRAVSGTVPVYRHTGSEGGLPDSGNDSMGRTIYKHLMNGVSHMLPFVIGGGILIALAFLLMITPLILPTLVRTRLWQHTLRPLESRPLA